MALDADARQDMKDAYLEPKLQWLNGDEECGDDANYS
jgi:hypothetical protein